MKPNRLILPVIVLSQFCGTSLWFASNGIMPDLTDTYDLATTALGHLTSAVQLGFISGTLIFAVLTIADRFSPSRVFFISSVLGAIINFGLIWEGNNFLSLLILRFLTGFFLAGIYPIGMKIAADHFRQDLGKSLGFLVGALVIGTAFPHLLNGLSGDFSWRTVIITTSLASAGGGAFIITLVPDGPFRRPSRRIDLTALLKLFKNRKFRSAAFGYFGHMWELYAFWAFVPVILINYNSNSGSSLNTSLISFLIIGLGGLSCIAGGYISMSYGTKKTASAALLLSGICCLISPFMLISDSPIVLISFLIFWGLMVIADSPLFSTLVADHSDPESKGTALTIVNSIGFAITIVSIQILNYASQQFSNSSMFLILGLGPLFGLFFLLKK